MSQVIRDYIPADEEPTAHEYSHRDFSYDGVGVTQDFIPDPDAEPTEKPSPEEALERAQRAAEAGHEQYVANLREEAKGRLAELDADHVVELLKVQVPFVRETYLEVEEKGRARKEIFAAFGRPVRPAGRPAPKAKKSKKERS